MIFRAKGNTMESPVLFGSSSSVNGYSYDATYPPEQYDHRVIAAQTSLAEALPNIGVPKDNVECICRPFLDAYQNFLAADTDTEDFKQSPLLALQEFNRLKAQLPPVHQDKLTYHLDRHEKNMTFSFYGKKLCTFEQSYTRELPTHTFNDLTIHLVQQTMTKRLMSLQKIEEEAQALECCRPFLEAYRDYLCCEECSAEFTQSPRLALEKFQKMKTVLPVTHQDKLQCKVDIKNKSIIFFLYGQELCQFKHTYNRELSEETFHELALIIITKETGVESKDHVQMLLQQYRTAKAEYKTKQEINALTQLFLNLPADAQRNIHIKIHPSTVGSYFRSGTVTVCNITLNFSILSDTDVEQMKALDTQLIQARIPNHAGYVNNMENLKECEAWYQQTFAEVSKGDLTTERLLQLCKQKGELDGYITKINEVEAVIKEDEFDETLMSDEVMQQSLAQRFENLKAKAHSLRNEKIILKQLTDECAEDQQESLKSLALIMLGKQVKPIEKFERSMATNALVTSECKRDFIQEQLDAYLILKQKAPAQFADKLSVQFCKTKQLGVVDITIVMSEPNGNVRIARMAGASFAKYIYCIQRQLAIPQAIDIVCLPEHAQKDKVVAPLVQAVNLRLELGAEANGYDIICSVTYLKWLYQKDEQYIRHNCVQLLDYQDPKTNTIQYYATVEGTVVFSFSVPTGSLVFDNVKKWLDEENKMDDQFDNAEVGASNLKTFQQEACTHAELKEKEIEELQARLEQIKSECEQQAQEIQRIQLRQQELEACRQEVLAQLNSGFNSEQASYLFDVSRATNLSATSSANSVMRLFELSENMNKFKFAYRECQYLSIWYDDLLITTINYNARRSGSQDWIGVKSAYERATTLQKQATPQVGNALSMVPFTIQRIRTEMSDKNITTLTLPIQLPEYDPKNIINFERPQPVIASSDVSTNDSPLVSKIHNYALEVKDIKVDGFNETMESRFTTMLKECGGAKAIIADTAASEYAKSIQLNTTAQQTVSVYQLIEMMG